MCVCVCVRVCICACACMHMCVLLGVVVLLCYKYTTRFISGVTSLPSLASIGQCNSYYKEVSWCRFGIRMC